MLNRSGFDVAVLLELTCTASEEEIDDAVVELAKDYDTSVLEVWYVLAHALIERRKT